jgi:polyribonucleotide nucleotidyltransferase
MEKKTVEISISQVQTIINALKKIVKECEEEGTGYFAPDIIKEYKDAIIKFYYISEAQFSIQLTETDERYNKVKTEIEDGLWSVEDREIENYGYYQYLKELHEK